MDSETFKEHEDQAAQALKEIDAAQEYVTQQKEETATETTQTEAIQNDPRDNPEGWGIQGLTKEVQSILTGGIQDTASSIATLPERTVDMLSGEMAEDRKETGTYKPDWDPFQAYSNPIETKTWWGNLLRGVVHFGSLSLIPIAGWKSIAGKAAYYGTNSLLRAAAIGAGADLISQQSDADNALGMLRDRYGWFDTPLSTKDTDHPLILKLKNVVEGMGIGLVFDGAALALGRGSNAVKGGVLNRNQNIKDITLEKGLQELRENDVQFRASKNKPFADPHQGAHLSEQTPGDARATLKRTRTEWGAEDGSTGSLVRPVAKERVAKTGVMSQNTAERILQGLMSDQRYQQEIADVKAGNKTLLEVWGDALEAHQRITLGREAAELSTKEYLQEIFKSEFKFDITDAKGDVVDQISTITSRNVVVTDLVVGSLLKELRDRGISGREIAEFYKLDDIAGPAQQIYDTLMTALTEVKRSRVMQSQNFRDLAAGKQIEAKQYLDEVVKQDMADTRDSIMSILDIAKNDADDDLLNALFEVFSSMKTVNNLDDFDAWCRKIIKGGALEEGGPERTGALIRELQ